LKKKLESEPPLLLGSVTLLEATQGDAVKSSLG
jgi:hypothetical protein